MFLLWKLAILLLSGYFALNLYLYLKRRQYNHLPSVPIPLSLRWFMGHIPNIEMRIKRSPKRNLPQIIGEYQEQYGWDTHVLALYHVNLVITLDLKILPKLLTDRINFPKRDNINKAILLVAGDNPFAKYTLLSDHGTDIWAAKRRIMDPAFSKSFLRTAMEGMNRVGDNLIAVLETRAETGLTFDIAEDLERSAFAAISICGFNWSDDMVREHRDEVMHMARVFMEMLTLAVKDPLSFQLPWARLAEKKKFTEATLPMREVARKHIESVVKDHAIKDSIVSHIIRGNRCCDQLTIEDLVDEYGTFVLAGMETSSITMECAVWYLTQNQHVYKKAQDEVDEVFGDKDELSFEDVGRLVYLEMVVKECLRLKGPALGVERQCKLSDATINGVYFPKGTQFYVPFCKLHVDPRFWEDPEVFNPERFSPDNLKKILPYTYMPFSIGPRNCIGKNFAMLEIKILLSRILRNFVVVNDCPDEEDIEMMGINIMNIRPMKGVNVRVHSR